VIFFNQALLDQRRSVYRGMIQPECYQRRRIFAVAAYGAAMCEQGDRCSLNVQLRKTHGTKIYYYRISELPYVTLNASEKLDVYWYNSDCNKMYNSLSIDEGAAQRRYPFYLWTIIFCIMSWLC